MSGVTITIGARSYQVATDDEGRLSVGGLEGLADIRQIAPGVFSVLHGGRSHRVVARRDGATYQVLLDGMQYEVAVETDRSRLLKEYAGASTSTHTILELHAPMPALIGRVLVAEGEEVRAGQPLLVLEAMKMENELKAHQAGRVKSVLVKKGQAVEKGELLLVFGRGVE